MAEIRLLTSQYPDGDTQHRILVRRGTDDFVEVHQFSQFARDAEWLIFAPDSPLEDVRAIRIETVESLSWVAWFEVQVIVGTR